MAVGMKGQLARRLQKTPVHQLPQMFVVEILLQPKPPHKKKKTMSFCQGVFLPQEYFATSSDLEMIFQFWVHFNFGFHSEEMYSFSASAAEFTPAAAASSASEPPRSSAPLLPPGLYSAHAAAAVELALPAEALDGSATRQLLLSLASQPEEVRLQLAQYDVEQLEHVCLQLLGHTVPSEEDLQPEVSEYE